MSLLSAIRERRMARERGQMFLANKPLPETDWVGPFRSNEKHLECHVKMMHRIPALSWLRHMERMGLCSILPKHSKDAY